MPQCSCYLIVAGVIVSERKRERTLAGRARKKTRKIAGTLQKKNYLQQMNTSVDIWIAETRCDE